ncbi:DUF3750 domain-containing protein [Phreatobacter aquaticus]|uniref:DUF3750 domain-containing protein n=1 Tax=Phreatobacter aquaticus TaxID=2570229 RepID=A0A4D7QHB6_9HYPH|nr:DUF3750 domain-containing protein [Phreatobacter aquaticus]QCK85239.1 DUF3750 domain-containing protein [Phreatobacter aquaticus]
MTDIAVSRPLRPRLSRVGRRVSLAFLIVFVAPIAVAAGLYFQSDATRDWRNADRSSAGLLPPAAVNRQAVVRVFAARTVRWRGIFATHCWIVVKEEGASAYQRYDYTAWGDPIRVNGFPPDGRWFGRAPEVVLAVDGAQAAAAIPRIKAAIAEYRYRTVGDYQAWPGPNSNTFVANVMTVAPELGLKLPTTAIGKDYPYDGRWLAVTPSGTGLRLNLGGYGGFSVGWVEGIEVNLFGAVAGVEFRRPAINLPGLGRFGIKED